MQGVAETNARIVSLEKQLGLEPGRLILNHTRATARLAELEAMVAAKAPPVAAPKAAAPTAPALPAGVKSAADFLKMAAAERLQFCQDGNKIPRTQFKQLSETTFSLFLKNGGHLADC